MMFGLEGHVVCSTLSCRHESRWWMDNYHQFSAWKLLARWLIFLRRGVLFHLLENAAMTTLLNARKHMQIPSNTCMSQFILFGSNLNSLKTTNPASMVPVGGTALVQNCWRAAQCSRGEDFRSILCFHKTFLYTYSWWYCWPKSEIRYVEKKISCISGGTGFQASVSSVVINSKCVSLYFFSCTTVRRSQDVLSFSARMTGTCQVGEMIKQLASKTMFLHLLLDMGQHLKKPYFFLKEEWLYSLGGYSAFTIKTTKLRLGASAILKRFQKHFTIRFPLHLRKQAAILPGKDPKWCLWCLKQWHVFSTHLGWLGFVSSLLLIHPICLWCVYYYGGKILSQNCLYSNHLFFWFHFWPSAQKPGTRHWLCRCCRPTGADNFCVLTCW